MKKMKFNIFYVVTFIILASCNGNSVVDPQQIGKQAFDILKRISTTSKTDYFSSFLSFEEGQALAKNEKLITEEETRHKLTSMSREEYTSQYESDYNNVKERGVNLRVNWNRIEYIDYLYKVIQKDGASFCEGSLYFKSNDKEFEIRTVSVFDGAGYKLVRIKSLVELD